jgi:hypothetical protein
MSLRRKWLSFPPVTKVSPTFRAGLVRGADACGPSNLPGSQYRFLKGNSRNEFGGEKSFDLNLG